MESRGHVGEMSYMIDLYFFTNMTGLFIILWHRMWILVDGVHPDPLILVADFNLNNAAITSTN